MGVREQKKQRTREQVLAAASRLMRTQGYDETTMEDIATAAGIGITTLYRYFGSKEDLAVAPMRAWLEEIVTCLRDRPVEEPAEEALGATILWMFVSYERRSESIIPARAVLDRTPSPRARIFDVTNEWRTAMATEIARRLPEEQRAGLAPILTALVIGAIMELAIDIRGVGHVALDARATADEALRLLKTAALPLPGSAGDPDRAELGQST